MADRPPRDAVVGPSAAGRGPVPRREFVVLKAYIEHGSHKAAAHALGIAESTSRQRMSGLHRRIGARTMAQAVWLLRHQLEQEGIRGADRVEDSEQGCW